MKRTKWWWTLLSVLFIGLGILMFRRYSGNDGYIYRLPSQSKAIAMVDIKNLIDASESDEELMKLITNVDFVRDGGIDWMKHLFCFVTNKDVVGFLLPVSDEDKVITHIQNMEKKGRCGRIDKQFGIYWTVIDNNWVVGFDDEAMLIMGPGMGSDMMLKQEIRKCFEQKKQQSGVYSSQYAAVNETQAAVALVSQADVLSLFYDTELLSGLPEHTDLKDLNVTANIRFEKNKVVIQAGMESDNDELNAYMDTLFVMGEKLDGTYADYVTDEAMLWACVNTEGASLLKNLRKNLVSRTFLLGLNMCVDADLMIRSIEGDVAFTLYGMEKEGTPDYIVHAQLDNKDFLEQAPYWSGGNRPNSGITFKNFGHNSFYLGYGSQDGYFGVKDETLYLTSHPKNIKSENGEAKKLSQWRKEITSGYFFVWLNIKSLLQETLKEQLKTREDGNHILSDLLLFEDMVIHVSPSRKITIELCAGEGTNVIKELLSNEEY